MVTSDPTPVQGCRVTPLGAMRYRPAATPGLAGRWRRGRGPAGAPKAAGGVHAKAPPPPDALAARGAEPAVVHRVPTSHDFLMAIRSGLGWGMLPEQQLAPGVADGSLVRLPGPHVDVPLHWRRWRLASPALDRLGEAVTAAARSLRRPRGG